MFWNVRVMPRFAIAWGGSPPIRSPSNTTSPAVGGKTAVTTLKSVVFPAPLGPITPTISPGWTSKEMSERAESPPNDFPILRRERRALTRASPSGSTEPSHQRGVDHPLGRKTIITTSRIP